MWTLVLVTSFLVCSLLPFAALFGYDAAPVSLWYGPLVFYSLTRPGLSIDKGGYITNTLTPYLFPISFALRFSSLPLYLLSFTISPLISALISSALLGAFLCVLFSFLYFAAVIGSLLCYLFGFFVCFVLSSHLFVFSSFPSSVLYSFI
jgi:hypothetical protein